MRIKNRDIPALRERLSAEQNWLCALCKTDLKKVVACLDHDHTSGKIRSVLCSNCNGIEGKIFRLVRRAKRNATAVHFLDSIKTYWITHSENPRPEEHPLHRTKDEKRIARNKRARERRRKNKC